MIEETYDRLKKAIDEVGIGLTQAMKIADDAASRGIMVDMPGLGFEPNMAVIETYLVFS